MNEIVLIVGMQGSGKSTIVGDYEARGYKRFNRDIRGGSLDGCHYAVAADMKLGKSNYVLDNTYGTRESRKGIVEIARQNGYHIRAIAMGTSFEDCQFNVCSRMVKKYGRLMQFDDLKGKKDPILVPAVALYVFRNEYEPPEISEGFSSVESQPFHREYSPEYKNRALILDYDGCLRETISGDKYPCDPSDIRILPGRIEILKKYLSDGYKLLGVSNQSGVAKGNLTLETAHACFRRTNELLGLDIEYAFCPHRSHPISCFCRKPGPGLGVEFIEKYKLDPRLCIFVGDMGTDKTFAQRCGFKFSNSAVFFGDVQRTISKPSSKIKV